MVLLVVTKLSSRGDGSIAFTSLPRYTDSKRRHETHTLSLVAKKGGGVSPFSGKRLEKRETSVRFVEKEPHNSPSLCESISRPSSETFVEVPSCPSA